MMCFEFVFKSIIVLKFFMTELTLEDDNFLILC